MRYLNKLRPIYFFGAFLLGILYIYLLQPGLRYITKHPAPENASKIIYTESANKCFVYKLQPVECPIDTKSINNQPIGVKE
jgi:hypothetical protein